MNNSRKYYRRFFAAFIATAAVCSLLLGVRADEGMWTFDNPPLSRLKEKYGFEPTAEWFEHVRLASARLNNGGSGSFVSPDGLVLTNHHVARSLLAKLSTEQRDLLKTGFYAKKRSEELRCPDLEINVLMSMENVTEQIHSAGRGASDAKAADQARKATIAKIEKESTEITELRSNVITLYEGGEYWLYRFKKYTDIRLVFAPEAQAAEFGGDYDNFTFPRFAFDFTFLRVYENDKPAKTEHYFRWNAKGAEENELIFVIGNPGTTDRLRTVSQLEYQRDIQNPMQLRALIRRRDALLRYSAQGAEQDRRASDTISSINNSLKRLNGQQEGLLNPKVMQKKIDEEQNLRRRTSENAELQKAYGSAWDEMAEVHKKFVPMSKKIFYSNLNYSRLAVIALNIVQYAAEIRKPNSERLEIYRDSNLESLKFQLLSPAPIYSDLEEFALAERLQELVEELGADDPFVKAALNGRSPIEAAKESAAGTDLKNIDYRKSLLEGGLAAVQDSNDPMIAMARRIDPIARELDRWNRENFESIKLLAGAKVARVRFAVYGKSISPDANFTLRFSYGTVKGYELGTTLIPYKTTYSGLYDRAASFDNKSPFDLAPKIAEKISKTDLSTPLDFIYTADTIGGNSGSPVVNRNGELVGVNFDSNIYRFVSRYLYVEETGRAMAVHSAGMLEALRKIYDAGSLADELEGKK